MNISDVITLAKAGYKKRDIEDILKINTDDEPQEEIIEDDKAPDQNEDVLEDASEESEDWKSKYLQVSEELKAMSEELKKAQAVNVTSNIESDKTSDNDILINMARDFL